MIKMIKKYILHPYENIDNSQQGAHWRSTTLVNT